MDKETEIGAAVMAAFLRTGRQIDQASMLLLLTGVVLMPSFAALTLLAAGIQKYYALRVALDADLFTILARYPEHGVQWDAALAMCARRPVSTRTLALRWQGARRLQKRQMVAFAVQLAVLAFFASSSLTGREKGDFYLSYSPRIFAIPISISMSPN
jgi:hypothetical protein